MQDFISNINKNCIFLTIKTGALSVFGKSLRDKAPIFSKNYFLSAIEREKSHWITSSLWATVSQIP